MLSIIPIFPNYSIFKLNVCTFLHPLYNFTNIVSRDIVISFASTVTRLASPSIFRYIIRKYSFPNIFEYWDKRINDKSIYRVIYSCGLISGHWLKDRIKKVIQIWQATLPKDIWKSIGIPIQYPKIHFPSSFSLYIFIVFTFWGFLVIPVHQEIGRKKNILSHVKDIEKKRVPPFLPEKFSRMGAFVSAKRLRSLGVSDRDSIRIRWNLDLGTLEVGKKRKKKRVAHVNSVKWVAYFPQLLIGRSNLVPLVIEDLSGGCARAIDSFFLNVAGLNRASLAAPVNPPYPTAFILSQSIFLQPAWHAATLKRKTAAKFCFLFNRLALWMSHCGVITRLRLFYVGYKLLFMVF